jgi:hypothetical protein
MKNPIIIHNTTKDRNIIVVPTEISQSHAVKFPPGYSLIEADVWKDKVRKADALEKEKFRQDEIHEGVSWYAEGRLKSGELVVLEIEEKKEGKPVKRFATLRDFDTKRVDEIIADTHDSTVLKFWKDADSRDDVRASILTRMDKFNKKPS